MVETGRNRLEPVGAVWNRLKLVGTDWVDGWARLELVGTGWMDGWNRLQPVGTG